MSLATLAKVLRIAVYLLMMTVGLAGSSALAQDDTASRIQSKIAQVGANATKLRESGGDVSPIQAAMRQVDTLLRGGKPDDAEKILDSLLANPAAPTASLPRAAAAPADAGDCDPQRPMTISGHIAINADCTVGGDLSVTGNGVLHVDYTGRKGGRLVVRGNVIVRDTATLWVEGRADARAVFAIDNEFSNQRSMTSTDAATIRLQHVEFRTQQAADRGKGSVYMNYEARNRSSFEATDTLLVAESSWLLANLHDTARLSISDSRSLPTEIYVHDAASASIAGTGTRTGLWLDAGGAKGALQLPDTNGPFSWRIGAGAGLDVGWSLQVDDAQPGIGIEIRPGSALTIAGNGARAPATGELKISYFVIGGRETLDGLKAGLQNGRISDRLTLKDVQLGPIAWQIYAGDDADLAIRNSTVNEIGIFGRNAKVRVEHAVLQLAVLAALGPGSTLDVRDSEVWNQTIEAANTGRVSIAGSRIYGTLFHTRDNGSNISIAGGSFHENPRDCTEARMVDIATGQPRCNPFRPAGPPRLAGAGKTTCAATDGCAWGR